MKTDLQKRGNLYRLFQSSVFILFLFSLPLLVSAQTVQEEWIKKFGSVGTDQERSVELAIDSFGNSYVAGNSFFGSIGNHILIIKYSSEGEIIWSKRYSAVIGSFVPFVRVSDITVDDAGDVYLAGTIQGGDSRPDLLLVKFNGKDGTVLWKLDQGPDMASFGNNIKLDSKGGVYVDGTTASMFPPFSTSFLHKYNADDGKLLWRKSYTSFYDTSELHGIFSFVIDNAGDVYITGTIGRIVALSDVVTVKYRGSDGERLWLQNYDSKLSDNVTGLTIDNTGGVYIAVSSQATPADAVLFRLIKYDASDGTIGWIQEAISGGENIQAISNLSVDNAGGLLMTGIINSQSHVIRYNTSEGSLGWFKPFPGSVSALALDDIGGIYVSGTSNSDFKTAKYDALNGDKLWEILTDNGKNEVPIELALDSDFNVFVAGFSSDESPGSEFILVKYSQELDPCNIQVEVNLYLPPVAKRVGWQVRTTADFGSYTLTEDTGIRWTWGDGTPPTISYTAFGTPRITGEHTYQQAGIYQIGLDFTQSCLKPTNINYEQWMPIFDPEAGFVTGAGQATALGQRLGFNFSLGYSAKFATEPRGHTHFLIQDLGMFRSRSLEWLVVSGNKATWKGEGVIDGKGRYGFIASVADAGNPGADDTGDRLRVKVWDMDRGNRVVYDSFAIGGEILDMVNQGPTINRGNIIIHRPGNARMAAKANSKAQVAEAGSQLTAYPNTFSERTIISFSLKQEQHYTLEIYDTKGRLVKQLAQGRAEASTTYEHELNGQGLNAGLYIARLITVNGSQSIKLLLKH